MAIYKVIKGGNGYKDESTYHDVLTYVMQSKKVSDGGVIGGAVNPKYAVEQMERIAQVYRKKKGVKVRHSVLSFDPCEGITARQAKEIARNAVAYYSGSYQIIAAVHEDADHLHIHFVMNRVNYLTGKKYGGKKRDYYGFLRWLNEIMRPYHVNVKPAD